MSWVEKNWKPLTVVGGLIGLSWFAGKRFEEAETFNAEYEDCQVCFTTVEKGGLNDVQAGLICDTCYDMNKYAGGTGRENNRPYSAETFDAEGVWRWDYDPMMQNRIDRNECSHRYDDGDSRGGDAWVLKYADLMGVEDGVSYIEAGVKCGICGQERIGSWGINEREGFQITKGEEGRMPRFYGFYGAEPNERSE